MGLKFRVHPLFFAFGFFYAFTGEILIFIIYTLTDFLHEVGHSIVAGRQGYCLNKITLMPFGAVVSGETNGMNNRDELKIAIAGPLTNILISIFFVAVWWIFPPLYSYTDLIVSASLSLALINLLPFFPLDGGRILLAILSKRIKREKALKFCKLFGVFGGLILLALFIITIFNEINFSLLFFSLFIIFGAISNDKENKYVRIYNSISNKKLKRGIEYKKIAVDKDITIKKLISILDYNYINEVVIYENGEPKK
ncbi:MAG: site-2 protease family protein, partial [Firmicutes bacterium]|nr:site-2 protease family protein [Candidatus Caballimonas caccae]